MTTVLPPSARNQPPRLINNENMTLQTAATSFNALRSCRNMWSDTSSSPAASSSISTGQNSRIRSHSPYDLLNSPSNSGSAPSLQLTLSHNGSDTSDSSAWVSVNPAGGPTSMGSGSAGASTCQSSLRKNARNPQQLPPHSAAPISRRSGNDSGAYYLTVEGGVPALYSGFPNVDESLGQRRSISQSLHLESYSNPPRPRSQAVSRGSQAVSRDSQAFAAGLEGWDDLADIPWYAPISGAGLSWDGSQLATPEQPAARASSRETIPVSTSYPQVATTTDTTLRMVHDCTTWWKEYVLKPHHQFNDQRPLLGIPPPVGLTPAFSSTTQDLILGEPAGRIQMAAGVSGPAANPSFLACNVVTVIPPPAASSTSLIKSHPPSGISDGLSILPVAGPRGLKRPIEDELWEVPESTKIAEYAAAGTYFRGPDYGSTNFSYSNNLVFSPQRGTKRTRHRGMPATNDMSNIDSTNWPPQAAPLGSVEHHIMADSVDRHRGLAHEQHEAEEFSAPTGSADCLAVYDVDRTTHHFEPVIDMLPQLHVHRHSCDSDEFYDQRYRLDGFEAPVGGFPGVSDWVGLLNTPGYGEPLNSPAISVQHHSDATMGGSVGGDGSDVHNYHVFRDASSTYDLSSNPPSPSPVITPGESPGLRPTITYGPVRPPQTHLAVQQPHYNSSIGYPFPGEAIGARGSNSPPGDTLGRTQQAALSCISGLQPQDSGEEYEAEAEDNQFDVKDGAAHDTATAHTYHGVPPKKRRRAFTDDRRIAVHDVRRLGACIRCQYLRESCDKGSPCGNCLKVDGKQKIWGSMPCLRLRITDAVLFRKGNSKFQQERATPLPTPLWKSRMGKRELFLGRPYPIAVKYWGQQPKYPELRIQCQEFVPRKNDLLFETWNEDGQEIKYNLPAFAACELEDVSLAVRNYVRETFDLFKCDMVHGENPLVSLVFMEAIRYTEAHQCAKENKKGTHQEACMLKDALKIWILTRLGYEGFGIIRGHEEFGVDIINNPKSPYHGTVPIPPILDHQLDTVGIHEMIRLKDNVLKALKLRIQKRRESQWYEVFLTIFVLLHNLEYIARKQYLYTKRHESTWASNGERNIEFFRTTWMAEWETAANMLIKHFQVALKGAVPFTFNWEGSENGKEGTGSDGTKGKRKAKGKRKVDPVADAKEKAGMDDAAVEFMKNVCRLVRESEPDFQRLRRESERREYDRHMVWVSQLFLDVE